MGYEVAGVVETVGEGVDQSIVGVPVVAMTRFGGQSEKVVVPSGSCLKNRSR
jgi:NADPH:quinone reductase-like Zn-dependent oxidoreductase